MKISEHIFQIMKTKNVSQMELANAIGTSQSVVSDWKTKKTNPAANKIIPICDYLDVSADELLRGCD